VKNKIFSLAILGLLCLTIFTTAVSSSLASSVVENPWNPRASMQQARGGLGVVAVDGKVYAIGGKTASGEFVGTNEQYDPKDDTWKILEPMPTSRAYFAIVTYQNKIYCIGGLNKNGLCSITEVYDTVTGSWSAKTSLPIKGANLQGQIVDGKIFVLNGCDLFMYNPAKDVWTEKTSINAQHLVGSNFIASAVVDSNIVVTGNFTFATPSRTETKVMIYDTLTDVWREGAKPPHELSSGIAGATTGLYAPKRIYLIGTNTIPTQESLRPSGGYAYVSANPVYSYSYIHPLVETYEPVKGIWSTVGVPANRVDFGIAVLDDVLYIIGGYNIVQKEKTITIDLEVYIPNAYWATMIVSEQFKVPYYAVDEPTALNLQYIPIGYSSVITPEPSTSPSEPSTPFEPFLTNPIMVAVLVLTIGVVTASLFLYLKKRKGSVSVHE